jgi:hypothetical protein
MARPSSSATTCREPVDSVRFGTVPLADVQAIARQVCSSSRRGEGVRWGRIGTLLGASPIWKLLSLSVAGPSTGAVVLSFIQDEREIDGRFVAIHDGRDHRLQHLSTARALSTSVPSNPERDATPAGEGSDPSPPTELSMPGGLQCEDIACARSPCL